MSRARTFVLGDIHGCADEVDRLLDALAPATADTVVFLGDYVDRGPSSRAVIDRLLRLRHEGPRCVFLKGNHEDMFLAYMGEAGAYGEAFLFNGGEATLRSYGLAGQPPGGVAARLPEDHLQFLRALEMRFRHGSFLCVHAGVAPHRALDDQNDEDLLWIRDAFIAHPHAFGCTVLFGHTPHRDVLLDQPYKIGLDTGLVYWNKLSCLELGEQRLYQIRRGARDVTNRLLPPPPDRTHDNQP
jgi:serine/threonine protein phosphatase 1